MMTQKSKFWGGLLSVLMIGIGVGYILPHDDTPEVGTTIVEQGQISGHTLARIQKRGKVRCGVSENLPGFSYQMDNEQWHGLHIDFCRSLAAAIFGDDTRVKFLPLNNADRIPALQAGRVDLLAQNISLTMGRDANLNLAFAGIVYYDGQGFLIPTVLKAQSAADLRDVTACVIKDTVTAQNLENFFGTADINYQPIVFDSAEQALSAYDSGRCTVYSADYSALAAKRTLLKDPGAHRLLPDIISKEPLGPVLREGDENWADIVRWIFWALIAAEELGVGSGNVDDMLTSEDIRIRRLLGKAGEFGKGLGLSEDWAYAVIRHVGNYAEIYQRNLGTDTDINLPRGINALWRDGGILYSPPIR